MGFRKVKPFWGVLVCAPIFTVGAMAIQGPPPVGAPLQGLSQQELADFNEGRGEFLQNEGPPTGLGPVFNGTSCVNCHAAGAPGGASANLGVSVVTRIGAMVNGNYSDLPEFGGPVLQARSLRQFDPNYPIPGEVIPPQAQFVSRRLTTPLFGAGLIEAIPDSTILALQNVPQPDGIQGVANMVNDPETGQLHVGRFGWKSQHASLKGFAGDAYLNEMGITSPVFPHENLPQGNNIPPGVDPVPDPEDEGADVQALTNFMKLMAPAPTRVQRDRQGALVFMNLKCNSCHVPTLVTGTNPVQALSNRSVTLYSDLLLHRMGPQLADGIRQGQAQGDQWRTAPLWGAFFRPFFMHDGRANSVDQAIRMHGGEAQAARDRYINLSPANQQRLLNFINTL